MVKSCYSSSGELRPNDLPCDPEAETSVCCSAGQQCVSKLNCLAADQTAIPGTCTDQGWGRNGNPDCPCPARALRKREQNFAIGVTVCGDGTYCCGAGNEVCCANLQGTPQVFFRNNAVLPKSSNKVAVASFYARNSAPTTIPIRRIGAAPTIFSTLDGGAPSPVTQLQSSATVARTPGKAPSAGGGAVSPPDGGNRVAESESSASASASAVTSDKSGIPATTVIGITLGITIPVILLFGALIVIIHLRKKNRKRRRRSIHRIPDNVLGGARMAMSQPSILEQPAPAVTRQPSRPLREQMHLSPPPHAYASPPEHTYMSPPHLPRYSVGGGTRSIWEDEKRAVVLPPPSPTPRRPSRPMTPAELEGSSSRHELPDVPKVAPDF